MRRKRRWEHEDDDPAAGLLNLFDIWLVFAVSLLLAALTYSQAASSRDTATTIKNPGGPDMEIVTRQGREIETLKMTNGQLTGEGEKLGTAYRLKSGKVVYVPEAGKK